MSEEKIAKKIGATLIKNSGRGLKKGDMTKTIMKYDFLIDAKEGKSLSLNQSVWAKVTSDAWSHSPHHIPMIVREFPNGELVAVIPYWYLEEFIGEWPDE